MMNLLEKTLQEFIENAEGLATRFGFKTRSLTEFEKSEAKKVFGNRLKYDEIRIFEGAGLPNMLDDLGRFLKKMPRREINVKNAITLGNNCFFGRELKTDEIKPGSTSLTKAQVAEMSWLIHELTHAWQYQTLGWSYLWTAWDAQTKLGAAVYDFGGEEGLAKKSKEGGKLKDFNLEAQGGIVQKFYERRVQAEDTTAFEHFIKQIGS
jgi:hypothetical protein